MSSRRRTTYLSESNERRSEPLRRSNCASSSCNDARTKLRRISCDHGTVRPYAKEKAVRMPKCVEFLGVALVQRGKVGLEDGVDRGSCHRCERDCGAELTEANARRVGASPR